MSGTVESTTQLAAGSVNLADGIAADVVELRYLGLPPLGMAASPVKELQEP
jgi:hypothetical protein